MKLSQNNPEQLILAYKREAKKLHANAVSEQKSVALPILRRLLKHNVFSRISLPQLLSQQSKIQRKHLFQLLAIETGYKSWAELKQKVELCSESELYHFSLKLSGAGYPNLWFASLDEAKAYTQANSGEAIRVGEQAVVVVS